MTPYNLLHAIGKQNVNEVKRLLATNIDVNQIIPPEFSYFKALNTCFLNKASEVSESKMSASALDTKVEILRLLFTEGADPNIMLYSTPALFTYCSCNFKPNFKVVSTFLQHGADPNAKGFQGETVLHVMSHLDQIMDKVMVERNSPGIYMEMVPLFELLLLWGADPFIKNDKGEAVIELSLKIRNMYNRLQETATAYNLLKNDGKMDLEALRDFYALTFDEKMTWLVIRKLPLPKELKDIINSCLFSPTLAKYTLTDLHWKPSHLRDSPRSLQTQHATKPRF